MLSTVMKGIYTDLTIKIKVNGIEGEPLNVSNGVRQGCGASPLIFLLVQEALLSGIRESMNIEGIEVECGNELGEDSKTEVRERCLADDTVVYLKNIEQLPRLFEIIKDFEIASGQSLNPEKSSTILFGREKKKRLEINGMKWIDYGIDEVDEGLGIIIGKDKDVSTQWKNALSKMSDACKERLSSLRVQS